MMTIVFTFWSILAFLYIFYGLFVLVMGIYRAYLAKKITKVALVILLPWVIIGALFDVLSNILIATPLFLEVPKEWLVTDRLDRYLNTTPTSWRGQIATWICTSLLDYFDPRGEHCR